MTFKYKVEFFDGSSQEVNCFWSSTARTLVGDKEKLIKKIHGPVGEGFLVETFRSIIDYSKQDSFLKNNR